MKRHTYKLLNDVGNEIGVVHSPAMVGPDAADVHTLLVVPVRQVEVVLVAGRGLGWGGRALPVPRVGS